MTWFVITVSAVFGALIGSFLNVVVYRVPRGESVSHPASHCPSCDAPIRWWDNIPLISWLVLRGRCRDCGAPISVRYPLVETGTAVVFALVGWRFAASIDQSVTAAAVLPAVAATVVLVAYLYFAAISVALAIIDVEVQRLPNAIVLPAYVVGVVLFAVASLLSGSWWPLVSAAIAAAALFAGYLVVALIAPRGMGFGDVKLAGVIGLWLGWLGLGPTLVGAFAAFLTGGVFSVALLLLRRAGRRTRVPFGPWMLVGAWIGIAAGEPLWRAYLAAFGLTV